MIKGNTVFILGAGSSVPYGFPTGKELRKHIILSGMEILKKQLSRFQVHPNSENEIEETLKRIDPFINRFSNSGIDSIDKFLSLNPEFLQEGKIIISSLIIHYENKSRFNEQINNPYESQDWYSYIFNRLIQNINTQEYDLLKENDISFITFNYDRSLENYLLTCLNNSFHDYFERKYKNEKSILPFDIIHVYGSLGKLKVGEKGTFKNYGIIDEEEGLEKIAHNLNLIYEQRNAQEYLKELDEKIQSKIQNAEKIFFLGFGFAQENFDLLKLKNLGSHEKRVYSTVLGFEEREIKRIKSQLSRLEHQEFVKMEEIDCKKILRKYL